MKKIHTCIYLLLVIFSAQAQNLNKEAIDGKYTALFEEKGPEGPTKDKLVQLADNNGTIILAVAACERCFPAIYTYNATLSDAFGKTVFKNSLGIYAIAYDADSIVVVMPSLKMDVDFSYHNFYSKNKEKAKAMNKEKIETFAVSLLGLL